MSYVYEYWVGGTAQWDSTSAWSLTSGGSYVGAHVPDSSTVAIFDANSHGMVTMASPVSVAGLRLGQTFDGTIFQNAALSVSGDPAGLSVLGGTFMGGFSDITAASFQLDSTGMFVNTDATLHLTGTSAFGPVWIDAGTVALHSGSSTTWNGVSVGNLQVLDGSGQYSNLVGSCRVTDMLTLTSGALRRGSSDQTVHLVGDMLVGSSFGTWDSRNNVYVLMDAGRPQTLTVEGGVIPSLTVDKTTTDQVTCQGTGPVMINGDFNLLDGTFNVNGLGLKVGA